MKKNQKEKVKRPGYIGTAKGPWGLFLDDGNGSKIINIKMSSCSFHFI